MNEMYMRIEALCKAAGVNITQMCKEADVARAPLTELKKGRTAILSAKNAAKIAAYFNVSVAYLLGEDEKKEPADQKVSGLKATNYEHLTPENREVIDDLIDKLLKAQSVQ